jgi:hypothetical protein
MPQLYPGGLFKSILYRVAKSQIAPDPQNVEVVIAIKKAP